MNHEKFLKMFSRKRFLKSLVVSACTALLLTGCVSVEALTSDYNSGDAKKVEYSKRAIAHAIIWGWVNYPLRKNKLKNNFVEDDPRLYDVRSSQGTEFSFNERMALIKTLADSETIAIILSNFEQHNSMEGTDLRRLFDAVLDRLCEVCGPEQTVYLLNQWAWNADSSDYIYGEHPSLKGTKWVLRRKALQLCGQIARETRQQQLKRADKDVNLSRKIAFYGDSIETMVKVSGSFDLLTSWLRRHKHPDAFLQLIDHGFKNPFGEKCFDVKLYGGKIIFYDEVAVGFTKDFGKEVSPKEILESVKTGYGDVLRLEEIDHAGIDAVGNYTGPVTWKFETEKYVGAISFRTYRRATDEEKRKSGYDAKTAFNNAVKIAKVGNAILGDPPPRAAKALAGALEQDADDLKAKVQVGLLAGLYMWGASNAAETKTLTIYPKVAIEKMRKAHNDRNEQNRKAGIESRNRWLKSKNEQKKSALAL